MTASRQMVRNAPAVELGLETGRHARPARAGLVLL